MSRCRFVEPKLTRLPLSDGEWIEVKHTLSVGDWFDMLGAIGEKVARKDLVRSQMVAYVVNWSLRDAQGQPVAFTESALNMLDVETYHEIDTALSAHIVAEDAARAERVKNPNGATANVPTS